MLGERIIQRLNSLAVLPACRAALASLVAKDLTSGDQEQQRQHAAIADLYVLLGGKNKDQIERFGVAWTTLKVVLARLDHLQDNDPEDHPLPAVDHVGAQYNLVFAYYLLADSLLNEIEESTTDPLRLLRLRQLWTESLLRAASGQQQDLTDTVLGQAQGLAALDHYQQVAQAKSGAVFELGFGGVAILATDDTAIVHSCRSIGELFGTLIQFRDDLADAVNQTEPALTLPHSYRAAMATHEVQLPPHTLHPFWEYVYRAYRDQATRILAPLPPHAQRRLLDLLTATFE